MERWEWNELVKKLEEREERERKERAIRAIVTELEGMSPAAAEYVYRELVYKNKRNWGDNNG